MEADRTNSRDPDGWGRAAGGLALALVASVIGYGVGVWRGWSGSEARAARYPAVEFFVEDLSFSEVESAKALLHGAAVRRVTEIRGRPGMNAGRGSGALPAEAVDRAAEEFRAAIEEFRGTTQELFLRQHLLWLLHSEGRDVEWLECYLEVLYRHPTEPLVTRGLAQASRVASATGRESEWRAAVRFLSGNPLNFGIADRVASASTEGRKRWEAGSIDGGVGAL